MNQPTLFPLTTRPTPTTPDYITTLRAQLAEARAAGKRIRHQRRLAQLARKEHQNQP